MSGFQNRSFPTAVSVLKKIESRAKANTISRNAASEAVIILTSTFNFRVQGAVIRGGEHQIKSVKVSPVQ